MAFSRFRPGPSRTFLLHRLPTPKHRSDGPRDLDLSLKALVIALEMPFGRSSSHGIRRVPLRRHAQRASTPGSRSSRRSDGATRQFAFRPRGFTPPRRFTPHNGARVYCTPQPAGGSPRFWSCRLQRRPRATEVGGDLPRDAVHTLRRVPLVSSRTASLRPLPSCCYRSPPDCGDGPKPLSTITRVRPGPGAKPTDLAPEGDSAGSRGRQQVGCGTGLRCGDAPIRRSGPPRHRCAADSNRPKPGAGVAQNRVVACDAEATRCRARSNHRWGRA